jgi:hypothetical protein
MVAVDKIRGVYDTFNSFLIKFKGRTFFRNKRQEKHNCTVGQHISIDTINVIVLANGCGGIEYINVTYPPTEIFAHFFVYTEQS